MAYVTQQYVPGVPFGAYTSAEIKAKAAEAQAGGDWTWPHRSLSGYKTADGAFVPFGGRLSFDGEAAALSGVWTLDRSEHALSVIGLGNTGRVAVKVTEKSVSLPLANYSRPYVRVEDGVLDSDSGAVVFDGIYWQGNSAGSLGWNCLSVELSCEPGTILKSVACGGVRQTDGFGGESAMFCWEWDNTANMFYFPDQQTHASVLSVYADGISVDFLEGGVLTYHGNKVRKAG